MSHGGSEILTQSRSRTHHRKLSHCTVKRCIPESVCAIRCSFPGGSAPAPRLKPGEYLAWQIGEKLKVPINHSFLVSVEGEELESARVPSASDHVLGAVTDTNPKQPSGKEVL